MQFHDEYKIIWILYEQKSGEHMDEWLNECLSDCAVLCCGRLNDFFRLFACQTETNKTKTKTKKKKYKKKNCKISLFVAGIASIHIPDNHYHQYVLYGNSMTSEWWWLWLKKEMKMIWKKNCIYFVYCLSQFQ